MSKTILKQRVRALRRSGKTYAEIQRVVRKKIARSTLSVWCENIELSPTHQRRIKQIIVANQIRARQTAVVANRGRRQLYLKKILTENKDLPRLAKNKDVGKIILAMLYLAEGSKGKRGCLTFGNSDPLIIQLFLYLLRRCFNIDESKFRCTVQCRADANISYLEKFWGSITEIQHRQFYSSRIDPRTIGKKTQKPNYKGVCKLDYFSAHLYNELTIISQIVCNISQMGR